MFSTERIYTRVADFGCSLAFCFLFGFLFELSRPRLSHLKMYYRPKSKPLFITENEIIIRYCLYQWL